MWTNTSFSLTFVPMLPWQLLVILAAIAIVLVFFAVKGRSLLAGILRGLAMALILFALANPVIVSEERQPLDDIVVVITDRSASQMLGPRAAQTTAVQAALTEQLSALPGIETRFVEVHEGISTDGTHLFHALESSLADVPAERVAGAVFITDGIVHDIPDNASSINFTAPLHALITGVQEEKDRRIAILDAPRFGIVGRNHQLQVVVDERGGVGFATVTIQHDGEKLSSTRVRTGQPITLSIPINHAGQNIIEIETDALDGELTVVNNRALLTVEGIRDKLRVLLISGEPHPGGRTWRNLLTSDANVDLVHFTILRPSEKQDNTPINELSLIAFPTRELFQERIQDFDLIIFDRYANMAVLPPIYYDFIAEYVRKGGALLLSAGPEFSGASSLARTALGAILPATPNGHIHESKYKPHITLKGARHPVTRDLSNVNGDNWGSWLRQIGAHVYGGTTLMNGTNDLPLLVLSHYHKGRIALLLSDHAWLWARGFEGGGPHVDLLRRLSHWLMCEPALEEEALRVHAQGGIITVERQTMADVPQPVDVTAPDGSTQSITLTTVKPGLFTARIKNSQQGLYRFKDKMLSTFTQVGPENPREMTDVFSDTQRLSPFANATGGTVQRVDQDGKISVPQVKLIKAGNTFAGIGWIGLRSGNSSIVKGVHEVPLGIGLIGLALLLLVVTGSWFLESHRRPRN